MRRVPAGTLRLFVCGASVALASVLPHSSSVVAQQPPTFRVDVNVVEVDVHVVDNKGLPVRSLQKGDFRLLEDGTEQTIDAFLAIDVPVFAPATAPAGTTPTAADVAAAVTDPAETEVLIEGHAPEDSRFYLIILDDRQIDEDRTQNTIRFVSNFITNYVGPDDLAAIVSTSGRSDVSQTFTSDKAKLLKAIQRFMGRKDATWTEDEKFLEAMNSMEFVERVLRQLEAVKGRSKPALYVSEGLAYNPEDAVAGKHAVMVLNQEKEMIAAATRANVTIHPLDPRGLYTPDTVTIGTNHQAAQADATRVAVAKERGGADAGASEARVEPRLVGVDANSLAARQASRAVNRQQVGLRALAASTNGVAAVNTNKIDEAFQHIVRQESTYYLLSYRPKNDRREGKFRKIEVKVQGKGLKVGARKGYTEEKASASR